MYENTPNLLAMQARGFPGYPRGETRVSGRLCVSSDPSGALVYVDGIVATKPNGEGARTPTCFNVVEGRRDIVVRSEGYDDGIRYVDIYPNRTTSINVNLKSGKPGKVVPFGLGLYILSKLIL
jgi:hypothetical protein